MVIMSEILADSRQFRMDFFSFETQTLTPRTSAIAKLHTDGKEHKCFAYNLSILYTP